MDDRMRLHFIKLNVIKPKRNGQIKNLYNKDFDWLIKQAERVNELESALEFYANEQNYDSRHGMAILKDCGDKAREGLK